MLEQPLVSIIIPTYNRAHLIGETLDSVLAQTYQNWECIVVDDGSSDDTDKILAKYCLKDTRFKYVHRPQDRLPGGNAARNYGFELSKGTYIQWFDDDDLMLPRFLSDKVLNFRESLDLIICSGSVVDENLKIIDTLRFDKSVSLYKGFILWTNQITTNCVIFKRHFLLNKTLFNPKVLRGQESEFFSRLFFKLDPKQYYFLDTYLFLYRQHNTSKTMLNKTYVCKFKYSQSIIFLDNFKRSLIIKDSELINYCFQTLLIHFFTGLTYKDYKTAGYIYNKLLPILKKNYFTFFLEFRLIGGLMLFFKKSSYSVRKRWKNKYIC